MPKQPTFHWLIGRAAEHNPGGAYWHHVEGNLYRLWARALVGWYQAYGEA